MKNPLTPVKLLALALIALPISSFADSWSCRHDNDVREIHITQRESSPLPCSVVYKKLTEGVEDQVLWTAQNDAEYCQEKARAFVEKQIIWGWTCVETVSDDDIVKEETSAVSENSPEATDGTADMTEERATSQ